MQSGPAPPRRTGRADFPHPALLQSVDARLSPGVEGGARLTGRRDRIAAGQRRGSPPSEKVCTAVGSGLLRLASQLPSQKREALRQTPFGSVRTGWLVRSRRLVQSAHPFFDGNATEVRPLGSTDITPLPRYYGPLRLPTAAARQVMDSLPALSRHPGGHRVGSPRFLRPSFDTRPPQSPRTARRMPSLVASPPMTGFTLSGRLAAVVFV